MTPEWKYTCKITPEKVEILAREQATIQPLPKEQALEHGSSTQEQEKFHEKVDHFDEQSSKNSSNTHRPLRQTTMKITIMAGPRT